MAKLASMTGFARADGTLPDGASFLWEVRSVNGRGLDLRLRLPNGFDAVEPALRDAAGKAFKRGNISATLNIKREEKAGPRLTPDPAALEQALRLALDLAARIPGAPPPRAEALLALPGVLRAETAELDEAAEEARRAVVAKGFTTALQALAKSRAAEGARLAEILGVLIEEIAALVTLARAPSCSREPTSANASASLCACATSATRSAAGACVTAPGRPAVVLMSASSPAISRAASKDATTKA